MFKDQITGEFSEPGEKMFRVVLRTRRKVYQDDKGHVIGEGWEIAEEACVRESTYRSRLALETLKIGDQT